MGKKRQMIEAAAKLYSLGKKIEEKRERLRKLVNDGYAFDSLQMLSALTEFQKADVERKRLEREYLILRDDNLAKNKKSCIITNRNWMFFDCCSKKFAVFHRQGWTKWELLQ